MKKRLNKHRKLKTSWKMGIPMVSLLTVCSLFIFSDTYRPYWSFDWHGIRQEIKDSVLFIQEARNISNGSIGDGGDYTPPEFHTRYWIMENAQTSELDKLKEYPIGVVKATAFEALIKRRYKTKDMILASFQDSTIFFNYDYGCLSKIVSLSDYISEKVIYLNTSPIARHGYWKGFSESEIDSLKKIYIRRKPLEWKSQIVSSSIYDARRF